MAVHARCTAQPAGSAFESRAAQCAHTGRCPSVGIAVAQVCRVALDSDGGRIPIDDAALFSEMATYVLVRREGQWWLAAGQNTPTRVKPSRAAAR
ncbi:MAG: hypothetical protein QOE41_4164 [Mycobacterium sp.]|nr:hypothetical protein [Mycobacterium sp.]